MEILSKIQRKLKAPKGQINMFGNYRYRSCEDILEAVKPLLGSATLTLSDDIVSEGGRVRIEMDKRKNKYSMIMKDKIDLIFSDLKNEVITKKQAHRFRNKRM